MVAHDPVAASLAGVLVVLEDLKEHRNGDQLTAELARLEDSIREVLTRAQLRLESSFVLLSKRELNVLGEVADGLSNKQVARRLGISERTVRNHLTRIFHKLGVVTRTEAVVCAVRAGILAIWVLVAPIGSLSCCGVAPTITTNALAGPVTVGSAINDTATLGRHRDAAQRIGGGRHVLPAGPYAKRVIDPPAEVTT